MTTTEHLDRIDEFLFEIGPQTYVHLDRGRAAAVESLAALRKHFSSDGAAERVLRDPGSVASSREDALVDRIHADADTAFRTELQLHEEIAALRASIAEMERKAMDHENEEAAVCPEDVGFAEYIGSLNRRIAALTVERGQARDALRDLLDALRNPMGAALAKCMNRGWDVLCPDPTPRTDAAASPPEPRS